VSKVDFAGIDLVVVLVGESAVLGDVFGRGRRIVQGVQREGHHQRQHLRRSQLWLPSISVRLVQVVRCWSAQAQLC
jgi:hypothetical protein